jgi:hypothetical protein
LPSLIAMGVLATMVPLPAHGADAISPAVRLELKTTTQQLGELMRQDVEVISVADDQIVPVSLLKTTPDGTHYRSAGALVPFVAEGQGGGNFLGE